MATDGKGNVEVADSGLGGRLSCRVFQKEVDVLSSIKEHQPEPQIPQSIWVTLGLPSRGTKLHDLIREGLPFEFLDRIASLLQVRRGVILKAISVSPTKLSRRAKAGRLNTLESDRFFAVISVFDESLSLFKNDVIATMEWMSTPVRGLGSKSPLDMMRTRMETNVVIDPAGRLEKGVLV